MPPARAIAAVQLLHVQMHLLRSRKRDKGVQAVSVSACVVPTPAGRSYSQWLRDNAREL